jgi:hypothetical protein
MHTPPLSLAKLRQVPRPFSWVDQRLVRERYIDRLSHEACALYVFLLTVADAQGLSYYAARSLGQRLPMSAAQVHQARQLLTHQGLLAYRRPLYQVVALEAPERTTVTDATLADDAVAIKAVLEQIWEVLA